MPPTARAEPDPGTRIRMPWVIACVGLALLSGCDACDAVRSEGLTHREYRHVLVEELCAPGEFYSECWYLGSVDCHEDMPLWVADCIPSELERVHPNEALRKEIFECLFFKHFAFMGWGWSVQEREECVDAKRWKHVPPGEEATLLEQREEWKKKVNINPQYVPATPDTIPDTAPEPSPGTIPDQAPAP